MKIHSLQLTDFRCFENFKMEFDPNENVHVILADNMAGKSGIMAALTINLVSYSSGLLAGLKPSILSSDHRVIGDNPGHTLVSECAIETDAELMDERGERIRIIWKRFKDRPSGNNTKTYYRKGIGNGIYAINQGNLTKLGKSVYDNAMVGKAQLPLFNYVGTDYSHVFRSDTKDFDLRGGAVQGYQDWFADKSIQKSLFNWFGLVEAISNEVGSKPLVAEMYGAFPQDAHWAFEQAVKTLIPDIVDLSWAAVEQRLIVKMDGRYPQFFEMLSDGYRYLLLLAGELATRAIMLNKHLGKDVFVKTTGVVLIDEFGIHLHPMHQHEVLKRLSELFPNVQFIISTHSPLLINGLKKEQIHIIEVQEDGTRTVRHPDEDAIGLGVNGILVKMFGLETTLDSVYEKKAEHFKRLTALKAERELTDSEKIEYNEARAVLSRFQMDPTMRISDDPITEAVREKLKERETSDLLKAAIPVLDVKTQVDAILNELLIKK